MITRTSVSHLAIFIVSLFLLLPLLGIATSGVNDSPEKLESLAEVSYTHSSIIMNEPGFQDGSIFTRQTISAGFASTCSILDNSSIVCWGGSPYNTSFVDTGGHAAISIAGNSHKCAIYEEDYSLNCWGNNGNGQLGDGTNTNRNSPVRVNLGTNETAFSVSTGWEHTCAILNNASLKCWGYNNYGQIGDGTYNHRNNPTSVDLGANRSAVSVANGRFHTCAILDNASLKCWGHNNNGQLGDGSTTSRNTPVNVDLGEGRYAVAISAGEYHTCAILDNGSTMCWGYGLSGQLGRGSSESSSSPVYVALPSGRTAVAISTDAGSSHNCAILDNGSTVCWGENTYSESNGLDSNNVYTPAYINGFGQGRYAVALASGYQHSCVLLDDATMKCWGHNWNGQLGDETPNNSATPVSAALPTGRHIDLSERDIDGDGFLNIFDTHMKRLSAISAGESHNCAVLEDLSLYCWGRNENGQLGDGTTTDSSTPVAVILPIGRTASSVSAGGYHTCAVLDDASAYCWGANGYGSLGDGTSTQRSTPLPVLLPSGRTASSISAGEYHTCAVLDDASAYCWGYNGYGQLGDGTNTNRNTPVAVNLPSGRTASSISAGGYRHTCAVLDDASAYCWGFNDNGELGDGTSADSLTPVAVSLPSGRTASSISAGVFHTCAVLDDASAYCWGWNGKGQLGDGTTTDSSTPVAVSLPSGRFASSVSAGHYHTCAILDNASLYCWGANTYGKLGDGTTTNRNTPVAVSLPTGRTASSVSAGQHHTCAVLDDASVYCWGYNHDGQLGDDTTGPSGSSTPVATSLPSGKTVSTDSDLDGDGVVDTNDDFLGNPIRGVSCPLGYYGRYVCEVASEGHYASGGEMFQIECSTGTYQEYTGQSSCDDADVGYYVDQPASTNQTACPPDTTTYSTGSDSINDCYVYPDTDGDGIADNIDDDDDNDGYLDDSDAFPLDPNEWDDTDNDGFGNNVDDDDDNDGYLDDLDAFPLNPHEWDDSDIDGIGNNADDDDDNDGYMDDLDAFPLDPNEWIDTDSDGIGNNADLDDDNDGWSDITEIDCGDSDPLNGTSTPADYDEDGICNTLDADDDNDSYPNSNDDFPLDECAVLDTDGDGMPDWIFLNCNTNLSEDIDDDNDGYNDTNDSHPLDPTEWFDTDNDGIGNNADTDDDGDNVPDQFDAFPLDSTEWMDTDGDGVGDNADTDNDDDGVLDTNDDFPNDANETTDTDGDGIGNNADDDDDGDGYLDIYDQFPLDSTEWVDTDLDGIGNNADSDDDGDGWSDSDEFICGSDELDANDVPDDSDGDGICDSEDDDSTGLAVIVDVIRNPLVVGLFLLMGAIIIVTLFLQSRNQSKDKLFDGEKHDDLIDTYIEKYVENMVSQGYDEQAARQYAEQYYASNKVE